MRLSGDDPPAKKVEALTPLFMVGRQKTPDAVLAVDAECETVLGWQLAACLGRDDFSSILIEDVLLDRLSHDKKLDLLRRLLARHAISQAPYDRLAADLAALRQFRNELAHTAAGRPGDTFKRVRRRGGQSSM